MRASSTNSPGKPTDYRGLIKSPRQEHRLSEKYKVQRPLICLIIRYLYTPSTAHRRFVCKGGGAKIQLGYVLIMTDDYGSCSILHYDSNNFRSIAISVMTAEVQALVLGFDYAFLAKFLSEEIIGRTLELETMMNSRTMFDVVSKDGATTKHRLQNTRFWICARAMTTGNYPRSLGSRSAITRQTPSQTLC